jgi:hypothetical protein
MYLSKLSKKIVYVITIALICIFVINCERNELIPTPGIVKPPQKHTIPYPDGYDTTSSGASSVYGLGDHPYSPYFKHPDFYNMRNTNSLTIIPNFKTYQQTTEFHCGAAVALMVMYHYGITDKDELTIGVGLRTHMGPDGGPPTDITEMGTTVGNMVRYFEEKGWYVESALTHKPFGEDDYALFRRWVIANLKEGTPIMVEWVDLGGHWQNIIGFDTMGTDHFGSDILILADPYDTSDHYQDGYYVVNAERFFYMWFDYVYQPEGQQNRQWVIAKPQK